MALTSLLDNIPLSHIILSRSGRFRYKMPSSLHLNEDEEDSDSTIETLPEGGSLEELDEEKYLIQEEEEEESD